MATYLTPAVSRETQRKRLTQFLKDHSMSVEGNIGKILREAKFGLGDNFESLTPKDAQTLINGINSFNKNHKFQVFTSEMGQAVLANLDTKAKQKALSKSSEEKSWDAKAAKLTEYSQSYFGDEAEGSKYLAAVNNARMGKAHNLTPEEIKIAKIFIEEYNSDKNIEDGYKITTRLGRINAAFEVGSEKTQAAPNEEIKSMNATLGAKIQNVPNITPSQQAPLEFSSSAAQSVLSSPTLRAVSSVPSSPTLNANSSVSSLPTSLSLDEPQSVNQGNGNSLIAPGLSSGKGVYNWEKWPKSPSRGHLADSGYQEIVKKYKITFDNDGAVFSDKIKNNTLFREVDNGKKISVLEQSDNAIEGALLYASKKNPGATEQKVFLSGNPQFMRRAFDLAVKNNIKVQESCLPSDLQRTYKILTAANQRMNSNALSSSKGAAGRA